jgi:hypothetical protein
LEYVVQLVSYNQYVGVKGGAEISFG